MTHFDKHSKSIKAFDHTTEAMLDGMQKHGVDPETVTRDPNLQY